MSIDIAGIDVVVGERRAPTRRWLPAREPGLAEQVRALVVRELVTQLRLPYARERARLMVGPSGAGVAERTWGSDDDEPILLLGGLRADLVVPPEGRAGIAWIGDDPPAEVRRSAISPRGPLTRVLRLIAARSAVTSTDPTVAVIARALGVPCGESSAEPWDPYPLLEAFPAELWGDDADPTMIAAIGWRVRRALESRPPIADPAAHDPE